MQYPTIEINGEHWQVLSESNMDYPGHVHIKEAGYVRELELDPLAGAYDDYSYLRLDVAGRWWHYFPASGLSHGVIVDIDEYDVTMEELEEEGNTLRQLRRR